MTMVDFQLLTRSYDTLMDAEWMFRAEILNALNEIAEEKGSNILSFDETIDDPRNLQGGTMTLNKVEIDETSAEFTTSEGNVYYISDIDPKDVLYLVGRLLKEGKPYEG